MLQPGGVFALLTHVGFSPLDEQIHAVWTDVRSESLQWVPRDRETLFAGIEARLGNVSEVWAWLNQRDTLARDETAELFTEVQPHHGREARSRRRPSTWSPSRVRPRCTSASMPLTGCVWSRASPR